MESMIGKKVRSKVWENGKVVLTVISEDVAMWDGEEMREYTVTDGLKTGQVFADFCYPA